MRRFDFLIDGMLPPFLSIKCMQENIVYNIDEIDISKWIDDHVESKHRFECICVARRVYEKFIGQKSDQKTLDKFIKTLHAEIEKSIKEKERKKKMAKTSDAEG